MGKLRVNHPKYSHFQNPKKLVYMEAILQFDPSELSRFKYLFSRDPDGSV